MQKSIVSPELFSYIRCADIPGPSQKPDQSECFLLYCFAFKACAVLNSSEALYVSETLYKHQLETANKNIPKYWISVNNKDFWFFPPKIATVKDCKMPKSVLSELWNSIFKQKALYLRLPYHQCIGKTQLSLVKLEWICFTGDCWEDITHTARCNFYSQ